MSADRLYPCRHPCDTVADARRCVLNAGIKHTVMTRPSQEVYTVTHADMRDFSARLQALSTGQYGTGIGRRTSRASARLRRVICAMQTCRQWQVRRRSDKLALLRARGCLLVLIQQGSGRAVSYCSSIVRRESSLIGGLRRIEESKSMFTTLPYDFGSEASSTLPKLPSAPDIPHLNLSRQHTSSTPPPTASDYATGALLCVVTPFSIRT